MCIILGALLTIEVCCSHMPMQKYLPFLNFIEKTTGNAIIDSVFKF